MSMNQLGNQSKRHVHFKMYKSKRKWLIAGITMLSLGIEMQTSVKADTVPQKTDPTPKTSTPSTSQTNTDAKIVPLKTSGAATSATSATGQTSAAVSSSGASSASTTSTTSQTSSVSDADTASTASESSTASTTPAKASTESTAQSQTSTTTTVNSVNSAAPASSTVQSQQPATDASRAPVTRISAFSAVRSLAATPVSSTLAQGDNGNVHWTFDTATGAFVLGGGDLKSEDFTGADAAGVAFTLKHDWVKSVDVTNELHIIGNAGVGLFQNATQLTGMDKVDVSQATNLDSMFENITVSDGLDLNSWDVRQVTSMAATFRQASLPSLAINQWQTDSVEYLDHAFTNIDLPKLDIGNWHVENVKTMEGTFDYTDGRQSVLADLNVSGWITTALTDMNQTFSNSAQLTKLDIAGWNVSQVTDMTDTFNGCLKLADLDVSRWNVGQVTDFVRTFEDTPNLTKIDVSKWVVNNATNMSEMFNSSGVESLDLSQWHTSKLTSNGGMFGDDGSSNQWVYPLKALKVSSAFKFIGSDGRLPYIGISSDYPYTGRFVNEKTKEAYTAKELIALYQTTDAPVGPAATYSAEVDEVDRSTLVTQPIKIYQNEPFKVSNAVESITNSRGETVDPALQKLSYTGNLDTSKLGTTPITVSYVSDSGKVVTGQAEIEVVQRKSQAHLGGQTTIVVTSPDEDSPVDQLAASLFTGSVDDDGNALDPDELMGSMVATDSQGRYVDDLNDVLDVPGTYLISYSYTTSDGVLLTMTQHLTTMASPAKITLKQPTIIIGKNAHLNVDDYFAGATDAHSQPLSADEVKTIKFSGLDAVDLTKVGTYQITANYTDEYKNPITATTTITVAKSNVQLALKPDVTLIAGPLTKLDSMSVVQQALATDGTALTSENGLVIDESAVNPQVAGQYQVTVSYTDASGNTTSDVTTISVINSQLNIQVAQPTPLITGQTFDPTSWVTQAIGASGQQLSVHDLDYDQSQLDLTKAGTYPVSVSYTDEYGNTKRQVLNVVVNASPIDIKTVDQVNLQLGETFEPMDTVKSATGLDGQALAKSALTYDLSQVNLNKAGQYIMRVSYRDQYQNSVVKSVTINVSGLSLELVPAPVVKQGTSFDLASLVKTATDELGQAVSPEKLTYQGTVNTQVPGTYQLKISNQDQYGHVITKTVVVTVTANAVTPTPDPDKPTVTPTPTPDPDKPTVTPTPTPDPDKPTVMPTPTPDPDRPTVTPTPTPDPDKSAVIQTPAPDKPTPELNKPTVVPTSAPDKPTLESDKPMVASTPTSGHPTLALDRSTIVPVSEPDQPTSEQSTSVENSQVKDGQVKTLAVSATEVKKTTLSHQKVGNKQVKTPSAATSHKPAAIKLQNNANKASKPAPQTNKKALLVLGSVTAAMAVGLASFGFRIKLRHH